MSPSRRIHSPAFKVKLVQEALALPAACRIKPTCRKYPGVEPTQLRKWIKALDKLQAQAREESWKTAMLGSITTEGCLDREGVLQCATPPRARYPRGHHGGLECHLQVWCAGRHQGHVQGHLVRHRDGRRQGHHLRRAGVRLLQGPAVHGGA